MIDKMSEFTSQSLSTVLQGDAINRSVDEVDWRVAIVRIYVPCNQDPVAEVENLVRVVRPAEGHDALRILRKIGLVNFEVEI
jgi:hypothetical protein